MNRVVTMVTCHLQAPQDVGDEVGPVGAKGEVQAAPGLLRSAESAENKVILEELVLTNEKKKEKFKNKIHDFVFLDITGAYSKITFYLETQPNNNN